MRKLHALWKRFIAGGTAGRDSPTSEIVGRWAPIFHAMQFMDAPSGVLIEICRKVQAEVPAATAVIILTAPSSEAPEIIAVTPLESFDARHVRAFVADGSIASGIEVLPLHAAHETPAGWLMAIPHPQHTLDAASRAWLPEAASAAALYLSYAERERRASSVKSEAEATVRAKGRFLANISHELRTPLNGILGLTDLVLESNLGDEQRVSLELVRESSLSLLTIINDLLDYSKIEARKFSLHREPVDVRRLLERLLALLAFRADQKQLVFVGYVAADVPKVMELDPVRLGQVLTNLLGNAIKFTNEHGAVIIYVEVADWGETEAVLHLAVADTGIGIPPDRQGTIFEAFTQGDASTTRMFGGTGLGLSICRELVQLMGGTMWLRSSEQIGSVFHFSVRAPRPSAQLATLPRAGVSGEWITPQLELEAQRASARHRMPFLKPHILVAEDNPVNQHLIAAVLRQAGYRVTIAENGQMALQCLRDEPFSAVLMDCQMPILDGLDTTRAIRKAEAGSSFRLPIIALTAASSGLDREQCFNAGMDDFVEKPLNRDRLLGALKHHIERADATRS